MERTPYFKIILIIMLFLTAVFTTSSFSENRGDSSAGKILFDKKCVICHGTNGKGDGPAAKSLTPKTTDLTSSAVTSKSDQELLHIISEGKYGTGMVHFDRYLTEQEKWDVLKYMRSLGENK